MMLATGLRVNADHRGAPGRGLVASWHKTPAPAPPNLCTASHRGHAPHAERPDPRRQTHAVHARTPRVRSLDVDHPRPGVLRGTARSAVRADDRGGDRLCGPRGV